MDYPAVDRTVIQHTTGRVVSVPQLVEHLQYLNCRWSKINTLPTQRIVLFFLSRKDCFTFSSEIRLPLSSQNDCFCFPSEIELPAYIDLLPASSLQLCFPFRINVFSDH